MDHRLGALAPESGTTVWLTYKGAAARIGRSVRTITLWRAQGMPMEWRGDPDGTRERVVDETVLLAWFRDKLMASPAHQYRLRRLAREQGRPDPAPPVRVPVPTTRPTRPQTADRGDAADQDADTIQQQVRARREAWAAIARASQLKAGALEWRRLQHALTTATAGCEDVLEFTDDEAIRDDDQRALMATICERCPVVAECAAFADVAQPAGFWAGQRR